MAIREPRGGKIYIDLHDGLGCKAHFHEDLEFVLLLEGSVDAYAEEQQYKLSAGDAFVIFPHQVHSYDMDSKDEQAWLIIVPVSMCGDFKNLLYQYRPKSNRIPAEEVAPEIRTLLERIHMAKGPLSKTMRIVFSAAILGLILQNLPLEKTTGGQRDLLCHVLEYCSQNLNGDLQLDKVAKSTGVSKYHISHVFQKALGVGFHEYINSLRVNEAAKLLQETDLPITEIAYAAGFSCPRTFNRTFQKQMDCSPREYRKKRAP